MAINLLLNLLTLAIVAVAAAYVLRYAARLMGWRGLGFVRRGGGGPAQTADQVPGDDTGGACGSGACAGCGQREAHGKARRQAKA